jgi:hypothetical protein
MFVHHEFEHEVTVIGVLGELRRNDLVYVVAFHAVLLVFDQYVCMWQTPFLELDTANTVYLPSHVRKH